MAEDKGEAREASWRQLLPWTVLFRGAQIALDLNKLLLAAAGIFSMALGWWLLSVIFSAGFDREPPTWPAKWQATYPPTEYGDRAWVEFKRARDHWNLMHEAANLGGVRRWDALDLAESEGEANVVSAAVPNPTDRESVGPAITRLVREGKLDEARGPYYRKYLGTEKRTGTLSTWPWFEDRGPNPFLLVTGQAGIPWEPGHFWEWLTREQAPVMVEPVVKLMRPVVYFFSPRADGFTLRFYFLCVMLWTLAVWSVFGGAITRIAAVQAARGEKIGMSEAVRFTLRRLLSYIAAPLFPLLFVAVLLIFMCLFGFLHMIPVVGDIFVSGLFWFVMIGFGLGMAIALVGLVGWPLMAATISTEGTDAWEAVSRSYSYVYQRPWQYVWYGLVSICYGGLVLFFIGFLGSLAVYLSKWGVAQTPFIETANREPSYLFAYAPTSFGWRTLLLQGAKVGGANVVEDGRINEDAYNRFVGRDPNYQSKDHKDVMTWYNHLGAYLVAFWVGLLFLLILGFGYSFFWSAATLIYLLLRRQVDAAELDEVYLEQEEMEGAYGGSAVPPVAAPAATRPGAAPLTMVEPPSLRPSAAPVNPVPPITAAPPAPASATAAAPPSPLPPPTLGGDSGLPPS